MSLKGFHIVFIFLAVLVSLLFGAWALGTDAGRSAGVLVMWSGISSGILGVALAGYGVWFVKKKAGKIII